MFRDGLRIGTVDAKTDSTTLTTGRALQFNGTQIVGAVTGAGTGDVVGPAAATDNAIARYDTTTGKLIQNSGATVEDSGFILAGNTQPTARGHVLQPYANMSPTTGKTLISGTAYWCFIGWLQRPLTITNFMLYVTGAGLGAQTAEFALASTPDIPAFANQTMTKLFASNTVQSLLTTGAKFHSTGFSQLVPAGTILWAGIRTAMATTQPTIAGLNGDFGCGEFLSTAASGVLTGAGPWTGSLIAASSPIAASDCPAIYLLANY